MALPVKQQVTYWGIATVVFMAVLWFLGGVILPFLIGGAIAYFLDPVADRLEDMGLSRAAATAVITVVAFVVMLPLGILIISLLVDQSISLYNQAPELAANFQAFLIDRFPQLLDETSAIRQSLDKVTALAQTSGGEFLQAKGGEFLSSVFNSALGVVNIVVLFVIVPVVAFYMLLDWDRMIAKVDDMLPRDHAADIRFLAGEIDRTLASFIRGQVTVCLILGAYYAIALMFAGLQFGLVVGFIAGMLTFIPYVGALVGGALAIGLALFQFWGEWWSIGAVAIIFAIGQVAEGNVLTPKLVGSSVGLHPVWLIFALSAFGSVFGFAGMLIGVPVAASIGVVARFWIERYKQGRLYKGLATDAPVEPEDVTEDTA